jgi:Integrase zinc binding domain/RNase H-like domain found in reverse transcriptase/Chromo (CHRromatin Organisation MOdifier) domain
VDKKMTDRKGNPILRPCGYHSQTFSATEQCYPIYDREFLAVIRGLKHWDYLLKCAKHPVLVITDHANLTYYHHPHKIGQRVAGYIAEYEQYDIQLAYRPGASNRADALLRQLDYAPDPYNDKPVVALPEHLFVPPNTLVIELQTCPFRARTICLDATGLTDEEHDDPWDDNTFVQINSIQDDNLNTDIETEVIHLQTVQRNRPLLDGWRAQFNIEHRPGDLWWKGDALVVVGNDNLKRGVLALFHDSATAGHPGISNTIAAITPYYWWPGMRDFITEYVKGCATCQMNKVNTHPTKPPLYPITPMAEARPFQTVALDFIVKLPKSNGYDTILTITDHDCLKAALFIPCNETIDSEGVAKLYACHMVPHYGLPRKIISDRDPRFTSNFTTELCRILGVRQNISMAYHPQTDGQSERTNQSLEQYLRMVCANDQNSWAEWLPLAQYMQNSWPSSTTKKTPYELILGYTPHIHQPTRVTTVPRVTTRLQQIKDHRTIAQEALQRAQDHMIKEMKYRPFKEGERVWLEGTHLKLPYETMKLAPWRYGLFHITTKISDVTYRLKIPEKWKIHNVFHASLLTPYKEMEKHGLNFLEPPPDLINGEEEWEVEEILGDRQYRRKRQYLVRWKGYAPAHDSWVDESELHAPDLMEEYKRKNTKKTLTKLAHLTTADIPQPAQTPHHQSRMAEIPQDQSSPAPHQSATAEIPQDQSSSAPHQSATAEIPHDQSSREVGLQKYYDSLSIRTLWFEGEETSSPFCSSTGETTTIPQEEEACSSETPLHCCPLPRLSSPVPSQPEANKAIRLPTATPDIPVHNPRVSRILPQSTSTYIFCSLPPTLVPLP